MQVVESALNGVLLLEPKVFRDPRGLFFESYQEARFSELAGASMKFVQDNQSGSHRGVVRGLHYQIQQPQGKLVRALSGRIFDVAVDLRRSSPTFGQWVGYELSAENRRMLWVPAGFGHGFLALDEWNEVAYKTTDYWAPAYERTVLWNDPQIGIKWPVDGLTPLLSDKDAQGLTLAAAEVYA
jgi:dTDP-4-dehydrorhamnose 3,5-epimerase